MLAHSMTAPERIDRFQILRELGRGGMGVVYAARDDASGEDVALKVLRETNGQQLMLLKNEFRALADLHHRNLVALRELHSDDGDVFLTMELLDGDDLVRTVRGASTEGRAWVNGATRTLGLAPDDTLPVPGAAPEGPPPPEAVALPPAQIAPLREYMAQVAEGLAALHAARRLHRDVKPSNVLVTDEGRAVLLDFGLVAELAGETISLADGVAGSVPYMAPEQAAGEELSTATDWYAFGAMLYEALCGHPPFTGSIADVFRAKQTADPIPPSRLVEGVPPDLDALCMALLKREPALRPDDATILGALGRSAGPDTTRRSTALVGREDAIAELTAALSEVRQGRAATVHVRARSGIGKSALCEAFLDGLQNALILRARCFERDSVPFKALDPLVDQLARWLTAQPQDETAALVPRYARELVRLFPVLGHVAAIAQSDQRTAEAADFREQRRRAFSALRELLARLAERHTVVVHLDDLQWGDRDSGGLLIELTRLPDPPSMLLIASYRLENLERSEMLTRLREHEDTSVRTVDLEPLREDQAERLAAAILAERGLDPEAIQERARQIAVEAAGSPFFVTELAWHGGAGTAQLDALLRERTAELDDEARALLQAIALVAVPVTRRSALAIAGVTRRQTESLAALEAGHLLRGDGPALDDHVECYHDRVREAVVDGLDAGARKPLHAAIATTLEAAGEGDAELLTEHYLLAGRNADAARQAHVALDHAEQSWAFDRAAAMCRLLLELEARSEQERVALLERLATALESAGRGQEAATVYAQAADLSSGEQRRTFLRGAAQQLMWSGGFDRGREVLWTALDELGFRLPKSSWRHVLGGLFWRLLVRVRGLKLVERDDDAVDPRVRERIDLLLGAGLASIITDQYLAFYLLARGVHMGLRRGTRKQQVLALSSEQFISQLEPGGEAHGEAAFALAEPLAQRIGDQEGLAVAHTYRGMTQTQLGQGFRSEVTFEIAERIAAEKVSKSAGQLPWIRMFLAAYRLGRGRISEGAELHGALVVEARERGDLALEAHVQVGVFYRPMLMLGRPDRDRHDVDDVLERISAHVPGFSLMHFYATLARARNQLYAGGGEEVLDYLAAHRTRIRRSGALRSGVNVALYRCLLGAAALAAAESAEPRQRLQHLRRARKLALGLARWGTNGPFYAAMLGAGPCVLLGRRDEARRLLDEGLAAEVTSWSPVVRCTLRAVRAHYFETPEELEAVYAELRSIGIVDPAPWLRSWAPLLDAR